MYKFKYTFYAYKYVSLNICLHVYFPINSCIHCPVLLHSEDIWVAEIFFLSRFIANEYNKKTYKNPHYVYLFPYIFLWMFLMTGKKAWWWCGSGGGPVITRFLSSKTGAFLCNTFFFPFCLWIKFGLSDGYITLQAKSDQKDLYAKGWKYVRSEFSVLFCIFCGVMIACRGFSKWTFSRACFLSHILSHTTPDYLHSLNCIILYSNFFLCTVAKLYVFSSHAWI